MVRQVVILIGGVETPSGESARPVPVPLLDIAGRPFLDYLLDELSRYPTIDDILLLADHAAAGIAEDYHGRRWRGANISVATTPSHFGSAGALKHVSVRLQARFFLLNGRTFFDFNLLGLAGAAHGAPPVIQAAVKPAAGGPANGGVYCVDRTIIDYIGEAPCSLERQIVPRLVEEGRFVARTYDGFFVDISDPAGLARARTALPGILQRPAVFFDRDGVLNVDKAYVYKIDDFEWMPGAREAIRLCNDLGYYAFVVTNQSGVARGYYGIDDVHRLHDWMSAELAAIGAHIDDFQYCPYHEDGTVEAYRGASDRRKPAPGMILDCLKAWPVRIEGSLLVGDSGRDIEAAGAAGIPGHLFGEGDLAAFLRPLLVDRN
ncbi:hypothetical protein AYJ54_29635 [Bradyrhizobium centrolobii]|uniref:D,D-heptose 1,7-bisphosphate phosphatase n=1 Tax=Bradyrhizobium centrolobii TaxID=1505087 RepID=A0A176YBC3_9BRAD|nr:HAD-IIIA family hydrolase [Bradyrhizobium centrolobii]OAF01239.1 hypothetical protein AYJ54_29635 [Bradyrhizobium centrolobii]